MIEPPSSLKNNAHKRFYDNEDHYFTTISIADSDKPLLADDPERAMARVMAVTGVDEATAKRIVEHGSMKMKLEGDEGSGAERIVGATTDFLGIAFLDRARAAANSVARIVTRDLRPLATGFLISDRLLITNNHVFATPAQAAAAFIEFYYELDIGRNPRAISRFRLAPEQFFLTNDQDDLDYTVVAVGQRVAGTGELAEFGYLPLSDAGDKHMLGEYVNIIEHPEGDYKQAVLRENQLVWRLTHVLHYMADTNPGSSGSPVLNDEFRVVALHHWGEPHREMNDKGTREINEGIRISAIVAGLKAATGLTGPQRSLLDAALSLEESAQPITARPGGAPVDSSQLVIKDGTATWTIPITVSVRVGDQPAASVSSPGVATQQAVVQPQASNPIAAFDLFGGEKVTIDENYGNRSGYSESFLPGFNVGLPKLKADMQHDLVPLLNPPAGADPTVLKYEHFSLQMSQTHRMAYYTASNIDGGSWLWLIRSTGAVKAGFNSDNSRESLDGAEGAESGGETWFIDKRIDVKFQTNQRLYDHQKLTIPDPGGKIKRAFDRGHLTRRQEPSWGSVDRARRAEADTFHFTNCTPQLVKFNESAEFWQGIEQYVLDNATVENEKINVYTGPVFRPDDPKYRDVHVPMQFWKIVARVEGGKLKATALLANQTAKIEEQPDGSIKLGTGGSESFDDLGHVKQYQTSVKKVEELTGLDLGPLANADTLQAGPEALGAEAVQREITAFTDIRL